ncbi:hypothetical protein ACLOJK_012703 [Asimina triloba]
MSFYYDDPSRDDGKGFFFQPGISGIGEEKPPSRLRKQAPPSLQLDLVPATVFSFNPPTIPIPLLSPLVLAPPQIQSSGREQKPADQHGRDGSNENEKKVGLPAPARTPNGWQHPAVPLSIEHSSLVSFFQAQCVIVHNAQ